MYFMTEQEGFRISLGNTVIIRHSSKEPFLSAGIGAGSIKMHLGNFDIGDKILEKLGLTDYELQQDETGITVDFSRNNLFKLRMKVSEDPGNGHVVVSFEQADPNINRLWIRLEADKDEHIYGCGEQYSSFDLRGRDYPLWVREQGVGRNKKTEVTFLADQLEGAGGDYHTTYFPQPTFVSSRKYFCHVDESAYMNFHFSNEDYHELEIWAVPKTITFSKRDSYLELLKDLTQMLGRQPILPDWVYEGVWIGVQGGTETVLKKFENALDKGLNISGIWAQDWEGKRITYFGKRLMWNWEWDRQLYPGLDEEIKKLEQRSIGFLGYINPYLAVEGGLFKEASEKGLLVRNAAGEDYITDMGAFLAGHVDLTNPAAFDWYKQVIKTNMIGLGLKGWMADFGEYLPTDAVLYNKVSAEIMHNQWPVLWARCNREAVEEAGKLSEVVYFMRSGYTGTGRYTTMMWAGDQNVDWSVDDGQPSVITSALSLGMSGIGLQHSDIGGYTTLFSMKRTKELFMRWAEMGAFAPIMRTHEGNRPDDNWQFDSDEETLLHFAKMSRIYKTLSPYTKAAVAENASDGIPVMRPLFLHYEDDARTYSVAYEYLYGRDLLVAPVYEQEKTTHQVYLPEDEWVHLWSGKEYRGGEHVVEAGIGYPPVFYRKASSYKPLFESIGKLE